MGSTDATTAVSLGPIVLWVGAIMLVCAVPWAVRLIQRRMADADAAGDDAFDPEAALARYMARRQVDDAAPAEPVAVQDFGRKSL